MAIQIIIGLKEAERVKKLGAVWLPEEKGSWRKIEYPMLFSDISYLGEEIVSAPPISGHKN